MATQYTQYPPLGGIPVYSTFSALPALAADGATAITLDTDVLYIFNLGTTTWIPSGGSGTPISIGTIDSQTASANGAVIASAQLVMQSASTTKPGLVNNATQSFSGDKTFTGAVKAGGNSNETQLMVKAAALTPTNVTWTQTNGSETVSGNTLTRTAAGTGFNVTGGNSTQQIASGKNGYVQFNANNTTDILIGGISAQTNAGYAAAGVDFGFYFPGSSPYQFIEAGSTFSGNAFLANDVFKIIVSNNIVTYYQNGVLVRTSPTTPNRPLFGQTTLGSNGASITMVIVTDSGAAQSSNIVSVTDSGSTVLAGFDSSANVFAPNFSGSSSGTNTGDVTIGTANGLSLAAQVLSLQAADGTHTGALTSSNWTTFNNKQAGPLTGDVTTSGAAATLATVNSNVGSFGSSTAIPSFTVNGKGLITAASTNVVIAPAGTLTGTTLASNVVTSSLTSLGTQAQALNMGSNKINNVTDPTSAQDAATKNYVDNTAAGINPAVAVQAATTSSANTSGFTYNNGVAGVGATFTGSVNTAVVIDGFTFTALGQRLLVKNDTQSPSGAFNGIYYVTQLQTGLLAPILTRALDYDQPSDINNTGAIPVINGTVNGTTQWVLTSLVNTVGTDPLTYTQFARNPSDYLLKANNLSDVSSKSTSFNNLSPMTTGGDIIYGGASGTGTRLANGSSGQVLTSNGGTSAPSWQTPASAPTGSYAQAFFSNTSSWTTASTSYSDMTNSGGNSLTVRQSNGITLTAGGSNVDGVTFTPANSSAVYWIIATTEFDNSNGDAASFLQLTDGTTTICASANTTHTASQQNTMTLSGIYVPGTGSAVTVKVQGKVSSGTLTIQGSDSSVAVTEWTIVRIA